MCGNMCWQGRVCAAGRIYTAGALVVTLAQRKDVPGKGSVRQPGR